MSGTTISAALDVVTPQPTDMLPMARSGSTTAYHVTMAEIAAFTQGGITGGTNPPAGHLGELLSAVITSPVTLTTGVAANIGSLVLSAGDWQVQAEAWFTFSSGGALSAAVAISQTSAAMPTAPALGVSMQQIVMSAGAQEFPSMVSEVGPATINTATTLTVYLCAQASFSGAGATTVTGKITARRVA